MEFLILILLILLNGVFALSELAIVSSRKSRLREMINKANHAAEIALELAEDSTRFLSTVQVGISLIGVIAGAFGGSALSGNIAEVIEAQIPALAPYANQIGFVTIVLFTTYLSLVIGELVPKRLALSNPERFAVLIAQPMQVLSRVAAPIVSFLTFSTTLVSRLIGVQSRGDDSVTEGEILSMIREGIKVGRFATQEQHMVREIFDLDETHVSEIMTPRIDIVWFDLNEDEASIRKKLSETRHSAYPVVNDNIDEVLGVVSSRDLLANFVEDNRLDLQAIMKPPVFVPRTVDVATVLDKLNTTKLRIAIILDEHGGTQGLLTVNDIVAEVFGLGDESTPRARQRSDGTIRADGTLPTDDLERLLPDFEMPEDETRDYSTLAGFLLARFARIPKSGDQIVWDGYRFQVEEKAGQRIERVIIKQLDDPDVEN